MDAINLDELPTGAVLLSRSGDILHINQHLRQMLAIPRDKTFHPKALKHLHPDDQNLIHDLFAALACGEICRVECCTRLLTLRREPLWVLISARVYKQPQLPRKSLLVIIHDMSLERAMLDEIEAPGSIFDKPSEFG